MENSRKQNNYELGAVPAEKRRPFDDLAFNDSSASVLNTNIKRKDSATESDTQDDDFEVKTPLVAVHPVNESTSSAGNSRMSLGLNNEGEEYDIEPNKLGSSHQEYRLYKRRWIGVIALVLLNIVKGCNWVWFGSISNSVVGEFHFTLGQVTMFGNIPHISYIVFSWCVPILVRRWGLRWSSVFGATILLISAWIRAAGTIRSLPTNGSYALIIIAQLLVGVTAPCFQVVGPRYAEVWFDLKGRATTTMIVAISDPLGTALGSIIAPLLNDKHFGIRILAVITSVAFPLAFLVLGQPPKPPTYSGSLISPPISQTLRAAVGKARPGEQFLTRTERLDFFILIFVFGVLVAGTSSFSVFNTQIFQPYGYSEVSGGIMAGVFLLSGLVAAILSAPIFDRVLVHHLAKTVKVCLPALGVVWVGLIFAAKPNNLIGIYAVLILIASISFILLPVGLELGVEITRNAETSTAVLWSGGNAVSFIWVLVMNALRAPATAHPPLNMHNALIFNACFIAATACLVVFFTGKQTRREMDEEMAKKATTS